MREKQRESYFEDLAFQMGLGPERDSGSEENSELTRDEMFRVLCMKLDYIADIVKDFANSKVENTERDR